MTVGQNIYEKIRNDVIFGRLKPSIKLKLNELKEHYGVSVSILRECLNRLASDGFILAEEQKGFFVAPVSQDDFTEIADLRMLLECNALHSSIKNGDTDWEANLVAAYHRLHKMESKMEAGDLSDVELWKQYDFQFHQALIQACGSKNLLQIHGIIFDKYLRYQMQILIFRGHEAAHEHHNIFESALARDTKKAEAALRTHITQGLKHGLSLFEKYNKN